MIDPKASRRRRRRWIVLLIPLVLVAVGFGWFWLGQPMVRRHQLEAACASADRVVLAFRTPPERTAAGEWTKGERVTCEIVGADKVRSLLAAIEPRVSIPYLECMCDTEPVMEVAQGGNVLASLTLHHDSALRWRHGKWNGDTRLTPASVRAMQAWIHDEGGSELSQLENRLEKLWDQYRAARDAEYKTAEAAGTGPAEDEAKTKN